MRDLLLRAPRELVDVDLAVEGDAVAFARRLASETGAKAVFHERFGTAVLELPGGSRLDLASTRKETYGSSGALPKVAPAGLEEDLARRDFSVNAIAIRLAPGPPELADPLGGAADLRRRIIRMLHARSPHDDPTRSFRAARYANRLGFSVESKTRGWIRESIRSSALDSVSGDRLRREIRLLFSEDHRARAAGLLARLRLDRAVDPALTSSLHVRRALARAEQITGRHPGKTTWFLYLLVWAGEANEKAVARIARRLALTREDLSRLLRWPSLRSRLLEDPASVPPSERISADEIVAAAALARPAAARALERRLRSLDTELSIRGRDLLEAGVPAGPRIGVALGAALEARRAGRISRGPEREFAVAAALGEAS